MNTPIESNDEQTLTRDEKELILAARMAALPQAAREKVDRFIALLALFNWYRWCVGQVTAG